MASSSAVVPASNEPGKGMRQMGVNDRGRFVGFGPDVEPPGQRNLPPRPRYRRGAGARAEQRELRSPRDADPLAIGRDKFVNPLDKMAKRHLGRQPAALIPIELSFGPSPSSGQGR